MSGASFVRNAGESDPLLSPPLPAATDSVTLPSCQPYFQMKENRFPLNPLLFEAYPSVEAEGSITGESRIMSR